MTIGIRKKNIIHLLIIGIPTVPFPLTLTLYHDSTKNRYAYSRKMIKQKNMQENMQKKYDDVLLKKQDDVRLVCAV